MTNNDDLMTRARRANPTPETAFQGLKSSPEAQATLKAILESPSTQRHSQPLAPTRSQDRSRRSRPRRAVVGVLVAAALLGGSAFATMKMSAPDPQQSSQVENDFSAVAEMHFGGWRPELAAESVVCLMPGRDDLVTFASDFPLGQKLTSERLAGECSKGVADDFGGETASSDSSTVCISDQGAPIAIVGVGGIDCSTARVTEHDGNRIQARAITAADLDELNHMRGVEVAVLAVRTEDGCPSSEEAVAWAQARLNEYGIEGLPIRVSDSGEGCYRGRIRWNTAFGFDGGGEIRIAKVGNQS